MAFGSFFGNMMSSVGVIPASSSNTASSSSLVGGMFQSPQERAKQEQEEAHRLRMLEHEQRQQQIIKIEEERRIGQEQKKIMFEQALQEANNVKLSKIQQATRQAEIKAAKFSRVSKKEAEYQSMLDARERELHLMANEEKIMVQYLIDLEAARLVAIKEAKLLKIKEQEALTREKWEADNKDSQRRLAILSERAMMGKEEHRCMDAWKYEAQLRAEEAKRIADEAAAIAAKNWSELLAVVKPQGVDRNPDFGKLSTLGLGSIDAIALADEADIRKTGMSKVVAKRLHGVCKTAREDRLFREAESEKVISPKKIADKTNMPNSSTKTLKTSTKTLRNATSPPIKREKSTTPGKQRRGSLPITNNEKNARSNTPKKNLKTVKSSPKMVNGIDGYKGSGGYKGGSFDSKQRAKPKPKTSADLKRPKSLTSMAKEVTLGSLLLAQLKGDSKQVETMLQERGVFSIAQLVKMTSLEVEDVVETARQANMKIISINRFREMIKKSQADAIPESSFTPGTAI